MMTEQQLEIAERFVPIAAASTAAAQSCGSYCVAYIGSRLDIATLQYGLIDPQLDPDGDGVTSIQSIIDVLQSAGLQAKLLQTRECTTLPTGLSILHVRTDADSDQANHFVVSEVDVNGQCRLFRPPLGVASVKQSDLAPYWDGVFISIANSSADVSAPLLLVVGAIVTILALLVPRLRRSRPARVAAI